MFEKYFGKYKIGLDFLKNDEYENAYNAFTNLINKNPQDYKARAYRGIISAVFLNKDDEAIYQDLKLGINAPFGISSKIYSLFSDVCFNVRRFDEAVEYANKAIKINSASDTNYLLLTRYYVYEKNDPKLLNTALEYIDYLMSKFPDDELTMLRAHALIKLNRFDEIQPLVDKLFFSSTNLDNAYLIQADSIFFNPNSSEDDLKNAISSYQEAITLIKDIDLKVDIYLKISEIHKQLHQFVELLNVSETILELSNDNPIAIFNKAVSFSGKNQYDEAISLLEDNMELFPDNLKELSNKFLALWYYEKASNTQDLKIAVNYALENAKREVNPMNYSLLLELYESLYDYENFNIYSDLYMNIYSKMPQGYYAKGYSLFLKGKPFKQYIKYYKKAAKLDKSFNKDLILLTYDRTKRDNKSFLKIKQNMFTLINSGLKDDALWAYRFASLGYLYNEYGFDVNYDEALTLINYSITQNDNSCDNSLKGAIFLKTNQNLDKAYELFNKAHIDFINYKTTCSCGSSFLARMYLEGIHVEKDEEKAMEITLDSYKKANKYMHSNSAILYAYFVLLNKENFNIEIALSNLKNVENELYYNSPVFYMIKQIYLKIGDINKADYYHKRMKESLLFEGKTIKYEMIQKLKSNDIFLPPFNNF